MARKRLLQDMLRSNDMAPPSVPSSDALLARAGAGSRPAPVDHAEPDTIQRGQPYRLSLTDETDLPLPPAVQALRPELGEIAHHYLRARRRSGQALLDAARWLSEARVAARHGEWDDFLSATYTSPDTAERLLRIYTLALQSPAFASAVVTGRLNQSAAERLARTSTPADVVETLLATEQPISVSHIERAIRSARQEPADTPADPQRTPGTAHEIPQNAEFGAPGAAHEIPQNAEFGAPGAAHVSLSLRLQEIASILRSLARHPEQVPNDAATRAALTAIALAVQTIQEALGRR